MKFGKSAGRENLTDDCMAVHRNRQLRRFCGPAFEVFVKSRRSAYCAAPVQHKVHKRMIANIYSTYLAAPVLRSCISDFCNVSTVTILRARCTAVNRPDLKA